MLRKRFSTALLALLVAAAIPGSAFAEEVESEATTQINAPITLSEPAIGGEEGQTPEAPADELAPVVELAPATEVQAPPAEEQPAAEVPPTEEVPAAPIVEPEVIAPIEEAPAAPIVEQEVVAPIEEAVVTEAAIVVPEVVTEPAIVVEPVAATLTITHRLVIGDQKVDLIQTFDELNVGQIINLADYMMKADNIVCITNPSETIIDGANDAFLLEYNIVEIDLNIKDNVEL